MTLDEKRRQELVDRFARRVSETGMLAPTILFLQVYQPVAFLGAQLLWFSSPFLNLLINPVDLRDFTLLVEDAAGAQALLERLESFRNGESSKT